MPIIEKPSFKATAYSRTPKALFWMKLDEYIQEYWEEYGREAEKLGCVLLTTFLCSLNLLGVDTFTTFCITQTTTQTRELLMLKSIGLFMMAPRSVDLQLRSHDKHLWYPWVTMTPHRQFSALQTVLWHVWEKNLPRQLFVWIFAPSFLHAFSFGRCCWLLVRQRWV